MGAAVARITKVLVAPTLAVLLAVSDSAPGAERALSWHDECKNSISFDPGKYDEARLKNTVHLLFGPPDFQAPLVSLPFNPQFIAKLDLERTNQKCRNALAVASRLEFIPLKGIEDYRRAKIAEIKDTCAFETVKIRGVRDPSALREYQPAAACSHFIDALEGNNSDIMTVFRETLDQNCSRNASPARCAEQRLSNSQKANGMEWVRLYLLSFGWNNCANKYTIRSTGSQKLEQLRAELEGQFRRAFKVAKECDAWGDGHREFGTFAVLGTDPAPGARGWHVLNIGLFCGSAKIHPGRIVVYAYGMDSERLQTGQPFAATFDIDGKATQLMLKPYYDVALAPVDAGFVRNLMRARAASISIKDYESPNSARLKLEDAGPNIRSALKHCLKS